LKSNAPETFLAKALSFMMAINCHHFLLHNCEWHTQMPYG